MKLKQKIFNFFLPLLAVVFTAAACGLIPGPDRGETVELVWWKPFDDPRAAAPLIEAFSKAYPNIRVTYVAKDIETYEDELLDALAAGEGPDIFSLHNDWLPEYRNKISPAPEKAWSLRDYRESFTAVASADLIDEDKIYAVALSLDVLSLYYNKDILASAGIPRPPASWEELVNLTPRLTRQDSLGNFERSAIALGTAQNVNRATDILSLLMLQNGTSMFSPDRTFATLDAQLADEAGEKFQPGTRALEFYTQFANPAKVTYTWNNRSNNSIEAFASGKVAMILSYSYLRSTLAARAPFLNYGIVPVPQINPDRTRVNFANYWAEAVSKQSRQQEAAWQFLKFISGKDALANYYDVEKRPSSRIDLLEGQIADADIGIFAENALSAKSFYKPQSDAVENIFAQMIDDVVLRSAAPQEAVASANQKLNLLLRNF